MSRRAVQEGSPSLDIQVRRSLGEWPNRPPGLRASPKQPGAWLKGRPQALDEPSQPYLKWPGARTLRTIPDGLYLHFSPRREDPYVDILCIEACSTLQNLFDKRSRFAPSTGSLLAVCPLPWLLEAASPSLALPRWRLIGTMDRAPEAALILPVRDVRVLYALRRHHYLDFAATQTAQPHELFCPMDALTDPAASSNPALRTLIARAAASANFMELPGAEAE